MMKYQDILENAQQLPPAEKARLLADISASLQQELDTKSHPKHPLQGIWQGINISADDIETARDDMWGKFPREDF